MSAWIQFYVNHSRGGLGLNDKKNGKLYKQYRVLVDKESNVIFGGRLGEYKYYDMDKTIEVALKKVKVELNWS